jgi:two-component system KDP operon response regulator KdpE
LKPRALIIDDEVQIRRLLRTALEGEGYEVLEDDAAQPALHTVAVRRPDIILLDLGLPDLDGIAALRRLREWSETPVIVLTVRDADAQKVEALDAGADDYLTKPFSTPELLARVRAALRRARPREELAVYRRDGLTVDLAGRTLTRAGEPIRLTATEWALLALLIRHAGRILTHTQILREVWGPKATEHREYLRVYFTHLRRKIERDPRHPAILVNEPGVGYRLAAPE